MGVGIRPRNNEPKQAYFRGEMYEKRRIAAYPRASLCKEARGLSSQLGINGETGMNEYIHLGIAEW